MATPPPPPKWVRDRGRELWFFHDTVNNVYIYENGTKVNPKTGEEVFTRYGVYHTYSLLRYLMANALVVHRQPRSYSRLSTMRRLFHLSQPSNFSQTNNIKPQLHRRRPWYLFHISNHVGTH